MVETVAVDCKILTTSQISCVLAEPMYHWNSSGFEAIIVGVSTMLNSLFVRQGVTDLPKHGNILGLAHWLVTNSTVDLIQGRMSDSVAIINSVFKINKSIANLGIDEW
jgi:hypothetical protein